MIEVERLAADRQQRRDQAGAGGAGLARRLGRADRQQHEDGDRKRGGREPEPREHATGPAIAQQPGPAERERADRGARADVDPGREAQVVRPAERERDDSGRHEQQRGERHRRRPAQPQARRRRRADEPGRDRADRDRARDVNRQHVPMQRRARLPEQQEGDAEDHGQRSRDRHQRRGRELAGRPGPFSATKRERARQCGRERGADGSDGSHGQPGEPGCEKAVVAKAELDNAGRARDGGHCAREHPGHDAGRSGRLRAPAPDRDPRNQLEQQARGRSEQRVRGAREQRAREQGAAARADQPPRAQPVENPDQKPAQRADDGSGGRRKTPRHGWRGNYHVRRRLPVPSPLRSAAGERVRVRGIRASKVAPALGPPHPDPLLHADVEERE